MESKKFFIVYSDPSGKEYDRTFTKSDVYWFGVEERLALQTYRQLVRSHSKGRTPHIKCLDLESLPEYATKQPVDDMISALNAKLYRNLNHASPHRIASRATTNQAKDCVTFSFSYDKIDENTQWGTHKKTRSTVHKENIDPGFLEQSAFNDVFEILLDRYLRDIDFITPVKINVNKKLYRKFNPTNQN